VADDVILDYHLREMEYMAQVCAAAAVDRSDCLTRVALVGLLVESATLTPVLLTPVLLNAANVTAPKLPDQQGAAAAAGGSVCAGG
jgi:hypothetical protein